MFYKFISQKYFTTFFLVILITTGCATKIQLINDPYSYNLNLERDFIIEGKFKLNFKDLIETGYFSIHKKGTTVELDLGRNFLLPNKRLKFNLEQDIELGDFLKALNFSNYEMYQEKKRLTIRKFLLFLTGNSQSRIENNWEVTYPEDVEMTNHSKIPKIIVITSEEIILKLLIKKVYA